MTSHTRQSPGIEFEEIDRSQYDRTSDSSIVGTTVFMTGFTDKGEPLIPRWINSVTTYVDYFGYPTNEPERYLYNGALEILRRGGVCFVSKLPYDNKSYEKYSYSDFLLMDGKADADRLEKFALRTAQADPSLDRCAEIQAVGSGLMGVDDLDWCRVNDSVRSRVKNTIRIVDITRRKYGRHSFLDGQDMLSSNVECLGVVPVLVGSVNAMYEQGVIDAGADDDPDARFESKYAMQAVDDIVNRSDGQAEQISMKQFAQQNLVKKLRSEVRGQESVSRLAVDGFPLFGWLGEHTLDKKYTKHIGLAVFLAYSDPAQDNKVEFSLVEFFEGSLDRLSKDARGASDYIGSVVNANSAYVNFFSNVLADDDYVNTGSIVVSEQPFTSLGFFDDECVKHIDCEKSIISPLGRIFNKIQDPNQYRIDVFADAGVTNIAHYCDEFPDKATAPEIYGMYNADAYPFAQGPAGTLTPWEMLAERPARWFATAKKFDEFCRCVRKDCIFVLDGYRPLVLAGNQKVVRDTSVENTVLDSIVPNVKYVSGLNSSFTAQYLDWFYIVDDRSGDLFWCPPSIKAAGVYVYTDAYAHPWNAPAGMSRGVVGDAYDVAFSPRGDEAGKIYQQAWNYAVSYPVDGIVVEGQKTAQIQQTALDRVNVRRMMIDLEKQTVAIGRRFLYEGNTAYTRQRFVDALRPIFENAVSGDGLSEYAIKCDDTLNTDEVVDRHELVCIIGVRPVKSIEWIKLGFLILNQSANITEEIIRT